MLYLIMGASGSGKSSCLAGLQQQRPEIRWHDFDHVPKRPTNTAERQLVTEDWVQLALRHQAQGFSTGIVGTIVFGEVLACPSASSLHGVRALLLDCADVPRIERIRARDGYDAHTASQDMLCWAAWLRMHASDPQWRQDVIMAQGAPGMLWPQWSSWCKGDDRWAIPVLENTALTIPETTEALLRWLAVRSVS